MLGDKHWKFRCEKQAKAVKFDTHQKFLDMIHGGKSIGEAKEACAISFEAAIGIMNRNTDETLRKVAKCLTE